MFKDQRMIKNNKTLIECTKLQSKYQLQPNCCFFEKFTHKSQTYFLRIVFEIFSHKSRTKFQ